MGLLSDAARNPGFLACGVNIENGSDLLSSALNKICDLGRQIAPGRPTKLLPQGKEGAANYIDAGC
jgi:hypothetical protein